MKQLILSFSLLLSIAIASTAQGQDPKTQQQNAKAFIQEGDYTNAILVLNHALQKDPTNLEMQKDLAFAYYLKRDYVKALETAKPFAERKDSDIQAYQILALVYKALEERKECEKLYKTALKKYPSSGVLYNEYGEMLWAKKEYTDAIKLWEKGIEVDPNNSGNYYNAAKFYYMSADKTWGLIYGELFINIESYSKRTDEIKVLLLEGYKKLFIGDAISKNQNTSNEFVKAFLGLMQKHSNSTSAGITPESLTTLRARFLLDWYDKYATRFPYRLFEHHSQLVKMGLFDAYNQWLFASTDNPTAYQKWTSTHADTNNEFLRLQKNRVFKVPTGQYYQSSFK